MTDERGGTVCRRQYFEHPPRSHLFQDMTALHSRADDAPPPQELPSSSSSSTSPPLSALLLTGLMYTFTISGAYGVEESVMGGGPLLTIVSIVVIPVLMGIPTALVVAEMASCVPSNAGFLMWMNLAFGRTLYTAMSLLSLVYIAVDNALYPVLFSEYACTAASNGCSAAATVLLRLGMLLLVFVLNVLGIETVGSLSVLLTVLTVAPFALMFVVHLFSTGFYLNWPAISYIPSPINWAQFISTASWNLSGLEQAGTVTEDIVDPQRTIMRALVPLMGLAFTTYIPPILTGASANPGHPLDLSEWVTGFWTTVGLRVGGRPLEFIVVVGSIVSAFGLTLSAVCTTSYLVAGVALTDFFPGRVGEWLSERNARFGTYHWAIAANTVCTALFSTLLDFGPLVKVDQFLYGIRVVAIFAAFLRCRVLYPNLPRPFRVPLSGNKLYAAFGLPTLAFVALTVIAGVEDRQTLWLSVVVVAATAAVAYLYCKFYHTGPFQGRVVTVETVVDCGNSE